MQTLYNLGYIYPKELVDDGIEIPNSFAVNDRDLSLIFNEVKLSENKNLVIAITY
ncbi:MAG: hypothetical protein WKG06_34830 [Segetibacter sp.]